ncbi:hypothetical protein B2G69_07335 [Methylorubrum zatmanii]|nr:hypothetical protein [Methylorubrum zatmanii]ARO53982.1 hypothetical protein B2G69_07335 [Methylorubrum zatmanii]
MRFEIGLSIRAYAKRRGVSDKAVRKAIASGRIAAAVLPDKTIESEVADRLWEANTDPSQRRGRKAERAEASMRAIEAAAPAAVEPGPDPDPEPEPVVEPVVEPEPDEDPASPRPRPFGPEDFEEDPPRRQAMSDAQMEVAEALAERVAANRARSAAGQARPSDLGPAGEDAEALMSLAVEEKREKVRKLRLANDREERLLIPADPTRAHVFAAFRSLTESWQNWPDAFAPGFAARFDIDNHAALQALRDGVREHLEKLSTEPESLVRVPQAAKA